MSDVVGQKFIFAVAQRPFETQSAESGVYNQFCSLLPLFDVDGNVADPHHFPDNGDVWWMVRPGARGLAEPGRLVSGVLQDSVKQGQHGFAQYQVDADSVDSLRGRDYVEIVDVPSRMISQPRDLVQPAFYLTMDHVPIDIVYVRWQDNLYGRFRTTTREGGSPGKWEIAFRPESSDSTVIRAPNELLLDIPRTCQLRTNALVSADSRPIHESKLSVQCRYYLVDTQAFDDAIPRDVERLSLRTSGQIIRQLAKRLLSRSKRQQLVPLLEELEALAHASTDLAGLDDLAVLTAATSELATEIKATTDLANAIVAMGIVDNQIKAVTNDRAEKHIAENAARLQSEVNKRIAEARAELESLNTERQTVASELETYRAKRKNEVEAELDEMRREGERDLRNQQDTIDAKLTELQRQEQVLSDNLEKVSANLNDRRDEVVNQLLTLAPLFDRLGLLAARPIPAMQHTLIEKDEELKRTSGPVFTVPAFLPRHERTVIAEEDFFQRFKSHAESRGFRYRDIDLLSYHVSVKCGDLTILGGLPGTGKSSLPRIYSQAIRGESTDDIYDRFLHVAVSPSWLDMRDLIGHVNALNQTFQPADSSLFQHLVIAMEEYRTRGDDTALYFVCLDEMNLSHVEHYLSSLLQVMEHPDGQRRLRCFPEHVVNPASAFGPWSSIHVPRSLRFIGTVNFDETTKQLSQRLLDRANLIQLPSNQLPLELEEMPSASVNGQCVRLRNYCQWIRNTAEYSDDLATLIDDLRDDLRALNCPMNPRRFSAMRKFLASWPEGLASIEKAVDLQFAQRILPQIRGLFQPGARDAVTSVRRKLEQHRFEFAESIRVLEDVYRAELTDLPMDKEVGL